MDKPSYSALPNSFLFLQQSCQKFYRLFMLIHVLNKSIVIVGDSPFKFLQTSINSVCMCTDSLLLTEENISYLYRQDKTLSWILLINLFDERE